MSFFTAIWHGDT